MLDHVCTFASWVLFHSARFYVNFRLFHLFNVFKWSIVQERGRILEFKCCLLSTLKLFLLFNNMNKWKHFPSRTQDNGWHMLVKGCSCSPLSFFFFDFSCSLILDANASEWCLPFISKKSTLIMHQWCLHFTSYHYLAETILLTGKRKERPDAESDKSQINPLIPTNDDFRCFFVTPLYCMTCYSMWIYYLKKTQSELVSVAYTLFSIFWITIYYCSICSWVADHPLFTL